MCVCVCVCVRARARAHAYVRSVVNIRVGIYIYIMMNKRGVHLIPGRDPGPPFCLRISPPLQGVIDHQRRVRACGSVRKCAEVCGGVPTCLGVNGAHPVLVHSARRIEDMRLKNKARHQWIIALQWLKSYLKVRDHML